MVPTISGAGALIRSHLGHLVNPLMDHITLWRISRTLMCTHMLPINHHMDFRGFFLGMSHWVAACKHFLGDRTALQSRC